MKEVVVTVCRAKMTWMTLKSVAKQGITHPFGDARTVKQAFPAGIETKESDPFLMCDYFDVKESKGKAKHKDDFPVDWHPHRGFDIATYLRTGTGRHGDSLGNRGTFDTPGMQWMSTGSGVVHAEGGANEKGQLVQGFQIWVNVPAKRKMDDPRYGTVPTQDLPMVEVAQGVRGRVLAGEALGVTGPFQTVQSIQMIDFELDADSGVTFSVADGMDTAILYIYEGVIASLNTRKNIEGGYVALLDACCNEKRDVELIASSNGAKVMLFAGKKLMEPVAWHGPIVMNTQAQVVETLQEIRSGQFPPKRVKWNYKRISSEPHV